MISRREEEFKKYLRAGEIASRVMEEALKLVKPGYSLLKLAEYIENKIIEYGGRPAFPTNISIGYEAAHYTPYVNDKKIFPEKGVVKIDIGVHIDGYIADMARSVDLGGEYSSLVEASEEALLKAIEKINIGVSAREIGRIIENTAKSYGYKTIKNLSGHKLDRYKLHAGYNVPNYPDPLALWRFSNNTAYAIEPFLTNGRGYVDDDKSTVTIYSASKRNKIPSNNLEEDILRKILERYDSLPFCGRWVRDLFPNPDKLLYTFYQKKYLNGYPLLIEISTAQVAQAEDTIVIYDKKIYVTTRSKLQL
ncbi:MAG: type II methionyl aminopeptidase [Sulfolobales archaeon]